MSSPGFFAELKRRSVYKIAGTYAVVAWLLIQIATQVFPFLQIPDWAIRLVIVLLALGFPIALILAWAFELTPEGIKRADTVGADTPRKRSYGWVYIVLIGATLSVGLFFLGRYTGQSRLAKIADLKVNSRTSTAKYKRAPDNLREIAKALGVSTIVEGSVQKSGDSVRINVQLIKASEDSHLWADTYDRRLRFACSLN